MSLAVSWRKDYNQLEYMCIRKEFFRKVSERELPGWYWILIDLREAVLSS